PVDFRKSAAVNEELGANIHGVAAASAIDSERRIGGIHHYALRTLEIERDVHGHCAVKDYASPAGSAIIGCRYGTVCGGPDVRMAIGVADDVEVGAGKAKTYRLR